MIPNGNTIDTLSEVWPQLSTDKRRLFDVITRSYLMALLEVRGHIFCVANWQAIKARLVRRVPDWQPAEERGNEAQLLCLAQLKT